MTSKRYRVKLTAEEREELKALNDEGSGISPKADTWAYSVAVR